MGHNNIYHIPAGLPFLQCLAVELLHQTAADPLRLRSYTIFLPNRRSCRALQEELLKQSQGRTVFLPILKVLGDRDDADHLLENGDLPRVLPPFKRLTLLTKLVHQFAKNSLGSGSDKEPLLSISAGLAGHLIQLLDQFQMDEVSLEALDHLVPDHLASHWQVTLDFLKILQIHWPAVLASEEAIDPYLHQILTTDQLIEGWMDRPPEAPIVIAGSLATRPSFLRLMAAVKNLPQGEIIFPGAPTDTCTIMEAEGMSPAHPYSGIVTLLKALDIPIETLRLWPGCASFDNLHQQAHMRSLLFQKAYHAAIPLTVDSKTVEGLSYVECGGLIEEAESIALMVRHQLTTPDQSINIITADRDLATLIGQSLRKWSIDVDDSIGLLLAQLPSATFFKLLGSFIFSDHSNVAFLALLKHPFSLLSFAPLAFRRHVRHLEKKYLRGLESAFDLRHLGVKIKSDGDTDFTAWFEALMAALQPLMTLRSNVVPLNELIAVHQKVAETLSTPEGQPSLLWVGVKGQSFLSFIQDIHRHSDDFPSLTGRDYTYLLDHLMQGKTVHLPYTQLHPVKILGIIEGRLHHADLTILCGLNEGSWPPSPPFDPWLNQSMRQTLGLMSMDQRLGFAAYDFAQAYASPHVIMTRSTKVGGAPTTPAPWLIRLRQTLGEDLFQGLKKAESYKKLARALRTSLVSKTQVYPAPAPPAHVRPRKLWVSDIELLRRSPYALYAKKILKLRALPLLNEGGDVALRGSLFHRILELFYQKNSDVFDPHAATILDAIAEDVLKAAKLEPTVMLFWLHRFKSIAAWFLTHERTYKTREQIAQTHVEAEGEMTFDTSLGPFTLCAKADRIDISASGMFHIIDYKTGMPPSKRDVVEGFSPQLSLEACIAHYGKFNETLNGPTAGLSYWWLKGGRLGGDVKAIPYDGQDDLEATYNGLRDLVCAFEKEDQPYHPLPFAKRALRFNDYDHLIRLDALKGEDAS